MSVQKIIDGLKAAIVGDFSSVTIEGQHWVRAPLWQPIETAPKDGTEILLFTTHQSDDYCDEEFSAVQIGSWDHGNEHNDPMWRRAPGWECSKIGEPTHWMPLPLAPVKP